MARRLRAQYAARRALWVAGSTHGGAEEAALIEAQRQVRTQVPDALLVIAPRHPQRFAEAAQALALAGVRFTRRSRERCRAERR